MRCLLLVSSAFCFVFVLARSSGEEHESMASCTVCSGYHVCRPASSRAAFECQNGHPCTREQFMLCVRMLSNAPNGKCDRPGIFPEPGSSTKYFSCKVTKNSLKLVKFPARCPPKTHFDSLTLRCLKRNEKAKLDASRALTAVASARPKTFHCRKPGVFPDPADCKAYYICDFRLRFSGFYCSPGTFFSFGRCSARMTRRCGAQLIRRAEKELEEGEKMFEELVKGKGLQEFAGTVGKKLESAAGSVSFGIHGVGERSDPETSALVGKKVSDVEAIVESIIGKYAGKNGTKNLHELQSAIVNETFQSLSDTQVMEKKLEMRSCRKSSSANGSSVAIIVVADCNCKNSSKGTPAADGANTTDSSSPVEATSETEKEETALSPTAAARNTKDVRQTSNTSSGSAEDNRVDSTEVSPKREQNIKFRHESNFVFKKPKIQKIPPKREAAFHDGSPSSSQKKLSPEELVYDFPENKPLESTSDEDDYDYTDESSSEEDYDNTDGSSSGEDNGNAGGELSENNDDDTEESSSEEDGDYTGESAEEEDGDYTGESSEEEDDDYTGESSEEEDDNAGKKTASLEKDISKAEIPLLGNVLTTRKTTQETTSPEEDITTMKTRRITHTTSFAGKITAKETTSPDEVITTVETSHEDDIAAKVTPSHEDDITTKVAPSHEDDITTKEAPSHEDDITTKEAPSHEDGAPIEEANEEPASDDGDILQEESNSQLLKNTKEEMHSRTSDNTTDSTTSNEGDTTTNAETTTEGTNSRNLESATNITTSNEGDTTTNAETTTEGINVRVLEATKDLTEFFGDLRKRETKRSSGDYDIAHKGMGFPRGDVATPLSHTSASELRKRKGSSFSFTNRRKKSKTFHCPGLGYFRDPKDCHSYYRCKRTGSFAGEMNEGRFRAIHHTCPYGWWFSYYPLRCTFFKPSDC